ncbi:MAG: protoporphyrinogen oxidase [Cyclonatronaceae bacterium]
MNNQPERRIAVIGGGISGLTVAWLLQRNNFNVTVFETRAEAGGSIGTEQENGWLAEKGPNSLLLTSRYISDLIDGLELNDHLLHARPEAKKRFIVRGGKPLQLPLSLLSFLGTPLFGSLAKMRLLREPFIAAGDPEVDESLAGFVRRRLGNEFLDYAINPFVSGVYAGDPEKLSARHAFPKLFNLEQKYGSLIRGQFLGARERKKSGEVAKDRATMLSFRGGLADLISALENRLDGSITYATQISGAHYDRENGCYFLTSDTSKTDSGPFTRVIYAGHAHDIAKWTFTGGITGSLNELSDIHYPPVTSVTLGFSRNDVRHPLDGFGMLVPEKEPYRILGSLFTSSIFEGRAPSSDFVTLTTYVGGTRNPEFASLVDDDLLPLVTGDLDDLLGLGGEPRFIRITRWPRAIPQYNVGYGRYKEAMSRFESDNAGIHILGNFRNGISVSDCIKAACELAEAISGEK